jgi:transcriptional regulator with XRE-family HTH domain
MTPGEKLKAYRKVQGLTRQQFADISMIPADTVRRWEDNTRTFKPWHINYIELLKESKSFKQYVRKLKKATQSKK